MASLFDSPGFNERLFFPVPGAAPLPEGALDLFLGGLHLRQFAAVEPRLQVLLFPGNGERACDYESLAPFFAAMGAGLVVANYRGYGLSQGPPTLRQALLDAHTLARAMQGPWVAYGRSLGCTCVAELFRDPPPSMRGAIWDSGFMDLAGLVTRRGLKAPAVFSPEDLRDFGHPEKLARWQGRLMILHGAEDPVIDPLEAQAAFNVCPSRHKELHILAGCGHDLFGSRLFWTLLEAFFGEPPVPT